MIPRARPCRAAVLLALAALNVALTPRDRATVKLQRRGSNATRNGSVCVFDDREEAIRSSLAAEDAALAELGLAANSELDEGLPLTAAEEAHYVEVIAPRVSHPEVIDETSRARIYRGMILHNDGAPEKRVDDAVASFNRIGEWLATHPDALRARVPKEHLLNGAMNAIVGGTDLYGHLVWAERYENFGPVAAHPLDAAEALAIRMKTMETVRFLQAHANRDRGNVTRYKQVYIIDVGRLQLSNLLWNRAVRAITFSIIAGSDSYYPETMWRCYIINAPAIFRAVHAAVKPFIHPVTREKIAVLGHGPDAYLPEMAKRGVPRTAVPRSLGGDAPDVKLHDAAADLLGIARDATPPPPPAAEPPAAPPPRRAALLRASAAVAGVAFSLAARRRRRPPPK